jgi:hypothetical protein
MSAQKSYRCPVCKKSLTKNEYDRALHIHEAQQDKLLEWERRLRSQERGMEKKLVDAKAQGRQAGESKAARTVKGLKEQLKKAHDRLRQVENRTTPQVEGLADEIKLTNKLRNEFRGDDVQRKGHAGDVLHVVKDGGQVAGIIIYECKREPRIKTSHVRQAYRAKQSRHADFAVLVTTGTKKGFGGLAEASEVLIVSQHAVLCLTELLRKSLIDMLRAGIEKGERAKIANELLRFIKSTDFKNPIEEVVSIAVDLTKGVKKEFQWHMKDWERRLTAYRRIEWDTAAIQQNLRRVLDGGKPKRLDQPKTQLLLPSGTLTLHADGVKAQAAKAGSR